MLPLGGFFLWGIRSKPKKSVGYSHWTSLNLQNHPMFYAKVCGGHGLLYACTANINISTGRLSSSFRSDMTKLNVKKRAFEAPLKFSKVLSPQRSKICHFNHKKHSHFLCYVFFGPLRNANRNHWAARTSHLCAPPLLPPLHRQRPGSRWRAGSPRRPRDGPPVKGWMKFARLDDCWCGKLVGKFNKLSYYVVLNFICLPHKSGCRRRQHWIKNSHDASFGFKWIWKITINSKFHSLLCCFQE